MIALIPLIEIVAFSFILFSVAITIHELAHAWIADRLGDPNPRLDGRLSLNPLKHYDPVGTTLLLITLLLSITGYLPFPFGWAKPVNIDIFNLAKPRRDIALISLAGPLANLLLAIFISIIAKFVLTPFSPFLFFSSTLRSLIGLNVSLAIFNLIPIHPLDGSKVLLALLPPKESREAEIFLNRYGTIILLFLIFPIFNGVPIIFRIIYPIIRVILKILSPVSTIV